MQIEPLLLTGILVGMFLLVLVVTMALVLVVLRRGNEHIIQSCETHKEMLTEYSQKYEQALERQGRAYMQLVVRQDSQIIATNARYMHATALLMGSKDVDPKMVDRAMNIADQTAGKATRDRENLQLGPKPRYRPARTPQDEAGLAARKGEQRFLREVNAESPERVNS